jgi:hypothetical protein
MSIKELLVPFLIGGSVIAGVKFAATHLENPALAAIVGGLPTGLIAIYFLASEKAVGYAQNYFYVALSLVTSIMIFYLLLSYTKLPKNTALLIALCSWASLVGLRYMITHKGQK